MTGEARFHGYKEAKEGCARIMAEQPRSRRCWAK
jgi:hypothetical protein